MAVPPAADPDHALLEWLAQCLQDGHGELAELVEEEDTVGGQADLAGAQRPAAAADQRDERRLMMRGAEGRAFEQRTVGQGAAGRRMDPRHGERLRWREARQEPGQALGEHGLARAGRPDHQQVMATGRSDLERPATDRLSTHVGELRLRRGANGARRCGHVGPLRLPAQHPGELGERRGTSDDSPTDERRLPHVAQRHDQPEGLGRIGQCDHARDMAHGPIQPELTAEGEACAARGAQLTGGHEEPDSDGKIEPRAPLRTPDGARFTVTRRSGQGRPLESTAARTRSRASRTAASGNPTMAKPGSPFETWTSTVTARPTAPLRVAEDTEASTREERSQPRGAVHVIFSTSVRVSLLTSSRPDCDITDRGQSPWTHNIGWTAPSVTPRSDLQYARGVGSERRLRGHRRSRRARPAIDPSLAQRRELLG